LLLLLLLPLLLLVSACAAAAAAATRSCMGAGALSGSYAINSLQLHETTHDAIVAGMLSV
jgi:hypothetical protein